MDIRFVTPDFAVGPQVGLDDIAGLKAAGIAAVICNRPDGEGADQPAFAQIAEEAARHGIAARYLPVVPGQVSAGHGETFGRLLDELPKPVLAFCRTGKRAESLWLLAGGKQNG